MNDFSERVFQVVREIPRGKEIYCQTGGAPGAGIWHSIFCSQMNRSFSCSTEVMSEASASGIGDDQLVYRC